MKNAKTILFCLTVSCFLLTACSVRIPEATPSPIAQTNAPTIAPQGEASPAATNTPENEVTAEPSGTGAGDAANMVQKTKDFILIEQLDRPEAAQYHWREPFLNLLDMESLYEEYTAAGGKADDVEGFAEYLTQNAPVPDNWKELFEADFAEQYGLKIVRYEPIQDTYYEAYVELDGSVVPYVAVNSRTGYFHG